MVDGEICIDLLPYQFRSIPKDPHQTFSILLILIY
jgi:hypothetical protein